MADNNIHGGTTYQYTRLENIINQFMIAYVGEDKIISKVKKVDVLFYAQRALQELTYDTLKSSKSREMTVPASLQMTLPHDYTNYTKISWVDSTGIKHLLYPTSKTSNPFSPQQDSDGDFFGSHSELIPSGELIKNGNFNGGADSWMLNRKELSNAAAPPTITQPATQLSPAGDPEIGLFYGFNGNAIGAYEVPQWNGIHQLNVPIISGEEYTISYTLSGYTDGTWSLVIVDENGDYTDSGSVTSNGTHTATLTAGDNTDNYTPSQVFIRNKSATPGNVVIDDISIVRVGDEETSKTWGSYKSGTPSENQDDYQDDTYWPMDGSRFGLDPQHAQANGSFYIDENSGKIHFSSNISGKTVILDYISDPIAASVGNTSEMLVHKFAEEAIYKWIMHGILSTRPNTPEYLVARYKKERFAAIRTAKLRLSDIKLEEFTQILRGKSKQIKH